MCTEEKETGETTKTTEGETTGTTTTTETTKTDEDMLEKKPTTETTTTEEKKTTEGGELEAKPAKEGEEEGDEEEDDEDEEDEEEGEDETAEGGAKDNAESADDISNLQRAWEMFRDGQACLLEELQRGPRVQEEASGRVSAQARRDLDRTRVVRTSVHGHQGVDSATRGATRRGS